MNFILFLALIFFLALKEARSATNHKQLIDEEWETFKNEYNKVYSSKLEEQFRMKIYIENRLRITQHNRNSSYKLEMNQFGDLLSHERNEMMLSLPRDLQNLTDVTGSTFLPPENFIPPPTVDWRDHGYVTPVKEQGDCAASWAFAATGALEGQMKRKTGQLVPLSEQDLIDCSTLINRGCRWGNVNRAFEDIKMSNGIDTESSYPYEGVQKKCRYTEANRGATVTGFNVVRFYSELMLQRAVASVGPIAALIDAHRTGFFFYKTGIYIDNDNCFTDIPYINHYVLVVGYGTENGQDYWLIKNSWGAKWGDNGYIKMARNNQNQCGIATLASWPLV